MPSRKTKALIRRLLMFVTSGALAVATGASALNLEHHKPAVSSGSPPTTKAAPATANHIPASAIKRISGKSIKYPRKLRKEHIQGTVVVEVLISKKGKVLSAHAISGPPKLRECALKAIRTWRYKPIIFHGKPVEVESQVNTVFSLGHRAKRHKHPKNKHHKH